LIIDRRWLRHYYYGLRIIYAAIDYIFFHAICLRYFRHYGLYYAIISLPLFSFYLIFYAMPMIHYRHYAFIIFADAFIIFTLILLPLITSFSADSLSHY